MPQRILLVDDDPTVRAVVARYLQRAGFHVDAVGDGLIARQRLDENSFDLAVLDPDEPMADRTEPELQRMRTRYLNPDGSSMTVAEVAKKHGQSVGIPQFAGTVETVTDQMLAYADEAGGDGFMLSPIHNPGSIEEFVDNIVPELQRRGRFRTQYTGSTVRDHIRQQD